MIKKGTIVLIEDDEDDKKIFEQIVCELGVSNKIMWFDNTDDAFNYISETPDKIFIIISDINLPKKDGLELKQNIDNTPHLRAKSIPFIFYSTWAHTEEVEKAYSEMSIQGFFKKENSYQKVKNQLHKIFEYWDECIHPDS